MERKMYYDTDEYQELKSQLPEDVVCSDDYYRILNIAYNAGFTDGRDGYRDDRV
jgi:hypothetical protein